ncbi:MAG: hypothetical protein PHX62_03995 [Bacilli bacterium]|nr:hypothetical protein [Bacilli bacterium]
MKSKKKLKQEYLIALIFTIVFIIIMVTGIILVIVNKNSISIGANELFNYILIYGLIILCSIGTLIFLRELIKYSKDFKAVKNGQFEEVTGTIIKFAKNQDPDSGRQINCIPIIKISNSDETIRLKINYFTKIGETYTFIYLKHTKMGAIKIET